MADKKTPTIVVKRIKKVSGGGHGGAWKIAYADFVTAMMAFFLLMWLLGSVDGDKLKGISEYFQTPLKTSLLGGASSGASNIMLAGGGRDLMQQGMRAGDGPSPVRQSKSSGQEEVKEQAEGRKMQEMKQKLETLIEDSPKLKPFKKQLLLDVSSEGLRVQIVDEQKVFGFGLRQPGPNAFSRMPTATSSCRTGAVASRRSRTRTSGRRYARRLAGSACARSCPPRS